MCYVQTKPNMNKFINREVEVLVEITKDGYSLGHTTNYLQVKILEELEQSGCSYREMEKHLKEKGIDATYETIRKRIVQKEAERKDIQSKKLHKELIECLIKLRESKKATDEQLEIIARQYGVSLNGTRMPKILLSEDELELD